MRALIVVLVPLILTGCMSEDVLRYDGVTTSAGDAIAANTAMQMVDPWPAGVEQTRLRPPAALDRYRATTAVGSDPAPDL